MSTETADSLTTEIAQATAALNDLRLQKADTSTMDAAKKRLGELRKSMAAIASAGGSKDAGKKKERLLLKTAKVRHGLHRNHAPLRGTQACCLGHAGLWPSGNVLPGAHRAYRQGCIHVLWRERP